MSVDEVRLGHLHPLGASRQCVGLRRDAERSFGRHRAPRKSTDGPSRQARISKPRRSCNSADPSAAGRPGRRAPDGRCISRSGFRFVPCRRFDRPLSRSFPREAPRSWAIRCRFRTWSPMRTIPGRSRRSGTFPIVFRHSTGWRPRVPSRARGAHETARASTFPASSPRSFA